MKPALKITQKLWNPFITIQNMQILQSAHLISTSIHFALPLNPVIKALNLLSLIFFLNFLIFFFSGPIIKLYFSCILSYLLFQPKDIPFSHW